MTAPEMPRPYEEAMRARGAPHELDDGIIGADSNCSSCGARQLVPRPHQCASVCPSIRRPLWHVSGVQLRAVLIISVGYAGAEFRIRHRDGARPMGAFRDRPASHRFCPWFCHGTSCLLLGGWAADTPAVGSEPGGRCWLFATVPLLFPLNTGDADLF